MRVVLDRARVAVPAKVGMPTELAAREWARPAQPLEWEWARAKLATQKLAQATWGRPRAT